jgi:hypothetical protein
MKNRKINFKVSGKQISAIVIAQQSGTFGGTLVSKKGQTFFAVSETYTSGHTHTGYAISAAKAARMIAAIKSNNEDVVFDMMEEERRY